MITNCFQYISNYSGKIVLSKKLDDGCLLDISSISTQEGRFAYLVNFSFDDKNIFECIIFEYINTYFEDLKQLINSKSIVADIAKLIIEFVFIYSKNPNEIFSNLAKAFYDKGFKNGREEMYFEFKTLMELER
jgi:hypothetical protein